LATPSETSADGIDQGDVLVHIPGDAGKVRDTFRIQSCARAEKFISFTDVYD